MLVTITLDIPDQVAKLMRQSSIERMINTTIDITDTSKHGDSGINNDDWREWKAPCVSIMECIKDEITRIQYNMDPRNDPWPVADLSQY